ncbi:lysosomal acid glucosylceramidase [Folsomia candida]|uniref:lysosomal acid glucosylceramidase n=1 Tax=Folsomia candida TaxID=158441 RepID=UPI001604DDBE|nr:lysosomal acid glucosylceramidase [Folsomia candida]
MLLSLLVLGLLAPSLILAADPCNPRYYPDGMVCVCDELWCDTIDPLTPTPNGIVQIFESDRDGNKRFVRRLQSFNGTEDPIGQVWNVILQPTQLHQEMLGIGGSFSDAAALNPGRLSPKMLRDAYTSFYGATGAEFALGRITISGSDFSTRPYSYDDVAEDIGLDSFNLVDEDISFKIPQLKLARELAAQDVKWYGSSWAPPAWMKTNGIVNGNGTLRDGPGSAIWVLFEILGQVGDHLGHKYFRNWGKEFYKLDAYRAEGVDLWGMTVQNEPMTGFSETFPWNTCGFTAAMERDFIVQHLGPNLRAAGYNTPTNFSLMILDHDRAHVQNWTETILADPISNEFVAGTAVHWYFSEQVPMSVYDEIVARFNKFVLLTEASMVFGEDPVGLGSWYLAETYMQDIASTTQHSVAGWTDWNLALNMSGGPTWAGASERSAPIIVSDDASEFYKMPMYYALAHWSKFVVPGSRRMATVPVFPGTSDFRVTAFLRPDGGVTIVSYNMLMEDQVLNLTVPNKGTIKIRVGAKSFNSYLYY